MLRHPLRAACVPRGMRRRGVLMFYCKACRSTVPLSSRLSNSHASTAAAAAPLALQMRPLYALPIILFFMLLVRTAGGYPWSWQWGRAFRVTHALTAVPISLSVSLPLSLDIQPLPYASA